MSKNCKHDTDGDGNCHIHPNGCPQCGAPEVEADTPRTKYACGSSDYDQRPGTFQPSETCAPSDDLARLSEINRKAVSDFIENYELLGEDKEGADAYYEPNEFEKALITDAVNGLLEDSDFVFSYDAERGLYRETKLKPQAPTDEEVERFNPIVGYDASHRLVGCMEQCPAGRYVSIRSYEELKAEVERFRSITEGRLDDFKKSLALYKQQYEGEHEELDRLRAENEDLVTFAKDIRQFVAAYSPSELSFGVLATKADAALDKRAPSQG